MGAQRSIARLDDRALWLSLQVRTPAAALYVRDHELWPTPGSAVHFAEPQAFVIASIMVRDCSGGTTVSASP